MALSPGDLDGTGIKIDTRGYLSNWADRPAQEAKPVQPMDGASKKKTKTAFSRGEELFLLEWCWAAQAQGVFSGSHVFEQLECLWPTHSWQAYESKWRNGDLSKRPRPPTQFNAPFPNLMDKQDGVLTTALDGTAALGQESHASRSSDPPDPCTAQVCDEGARSTYSDFRVDIAHALHKHLHCRDEDEFRDLLAEPWVLYACNEFISSSVLDAGENTDLGDSTRKGQGHHRWKVQRAAQSLSLANSVFLQPEPDKSFWNKDQHDIRFICMLVKGALGKKDCVWTIKTGRDIPQMCLSALWLMLWIRWLLKPTSNASAEMQRIGRKKEQWLTIVNDNINTMLQAESHPSDPESGTDFRSETSRLAVSPCPQSPAAAPVSDTTSPAPASTKSLAIYDQPLYASQKKYRPDTKKVRVPDYVVPISKNKNQQKGLFWLSEDAWSIYQSQRDTRLNSWGVAGDHSSTCVLVNPRWSSTDPLQLCDSFTWDPVQHEESPRLQLTLGDMTVLWARAAVWFETWPRRGVDLDGFLAQTEGPWSEMHGSHLCHQRHCVVPRHVVYEEKQVNLSRLSCASTAYSFRTYDIPIPEHCVKHQPPCLLQHASLTPYEAILVQFHVLRMARGLNLDTDYPRPADHPELFKTFETRLPLSYHAPAVSVQAERLVDAETARKAPTVRERFTVSCVYCHGGQHVARQITAFWSHIKLEHNEVSRVERLAEVVRTATRYRGWIEDHEFNYAQANPSTWSMLCQATSEGFTWEAFELWRLYQDRRHQRQRDIYQSS